MSRVDGALRTESGRAAEIAGLKAKFRVLRGWRITWNGRTRCKAEAWINEARRRATICAFGREPEPPHYLLHEILHVALRATRCGDAAERREREEILVQDLCAIFVDAWLAAEEGRLVALEHRARCDRDIISALESAKKRTET